MFRIFCLFLLLLPGLGQAEVWPQAEDPYVNDWAEVLPAPTEARIAQALLRARETTGVHIVLVTMGAAQLANAGNARIEPYATGLFNAWGIGDKRRNDGVLILIWPERREMRIALGRGYGPSWEGVARRVVDSDFLPAFRAGRMGDGIETGVSATIERIARPFVGKESPPVTRSSGGGLIATFVATIMGMVGVAGAAVVGMRFGRVACPKCGQMNTVTRSSDLPMAPFVAGHMRVDEFRCAKCGHVWQTKTEVYDRVDHNKPGGGYSSFGGGSSSGRGASGRW